MRAFVALCLDAGIQLDLFTTWKNSLGKDKEFEDMISQTSSCTLQHAEGTNFSSNNCVYLKSHEFQTLFTQCILPHIISGSALPIADAICALYLVEISILAACDTLSVGNLRRLQLCTTLFLTRFHDQYGDKNFKPNYHAIMHLARDVLTWGPCTVFWSYYVERWVRRAKATRHSGHNPAFEIGRSLIRANIDSMGMF